MGTQDSALIDTFGRRINYLRLSVTDRCNLRCMYCMVREHFTFIPHEHILTYEECLELIRLSGGLGVSKVRLTGGEPFVRKGFEGFLASVLETLPGIDLRVTTNATLIPDRVKALKAMGLGGLNVSLDTLNRSKYAEITGRDLYTEVRRAMDRIMEQGMRLKVNVVAMRGVNDDELADFVAFAAENPLDLRFIECMPVGDSLNISRRAFWPADEILHQAKELVDLEPVSQEEKARGPARVFRIVGGRGRLGLISPLSQHFCAQCNRFRITPDGRLRTCLFSEREYRLRPILRSSRLGPEAVLRVMRQAARRKPLGHTLLEERSRELQGTSRTMSSIGG